MSRLQFYQARLQRIFFGPRYVEADHRALTPRGTVRGIRRVLLVVGVVWGGLLLADLGARLVRPGPADAWDQRLKSGLNDPARMVGDRIAANRPNLDWRGRDPKAWGDIAQLLGVGPVARRYLAREDTTVRTMRMNAVGDRAAGPPPYPVVLSGDSYFNFDVIGDTLAARISVSVYNNAIDGRQTLSWARLFEDPIFRQSPPRVVVFELAERTLGGSALDTMAAVRRRLRRPVTLLDRWQQSLAWPGNIDRYLTATAPTGRWVNRLVREARWTLTGRGSSGILIGPAEPTDGGPPMLFVADEFAIARNSTERFAALPHVADVLASLRDELAQRGTVLVCLVAPDKGAIYPDRLPRDLTVHPGAIDTLTALLTARGVRTVNVADGLRRAARARPDLLYYYATDTHWSPRGQALAARILADSLSAWGLP